MITININDYQAIRKYIIRFLNHHHEMRYCYPVGTTSKLINHGEDPIELEYESVKALQKSQYVFYKPYSHLRRYNGQHTLVYVFLIKDMKPVKYAKYAIRFNTNPPQVFWLGYHKSSNPRDPNFKPLK